MLIQISMFDSIKIEDASLNLLPCDNCKHDKLGCCNYPDTEDDYCIMGDKQMPIH